MGRRRSGQKGDIVEGCREAPREGQEARSASTEALWPHHVLIPPTLCLAVTISKPSHLFSHVDTPGAEDAVYSTIWHSSRMYGSSEKFLWALNSDPGTDSIHSSNERKPAVRALRLV